MLKLLWVPICFFVLTGLKSQSGTNTETSIQLQELFIDGNREKLLGNWEKAVEKFEAVLKKDTRNHAVAYELARVYMELKKTEKALELAKNAVIWNPQNVWYKILLADLLQIANKDVEAADIYEQLLKDNPGKIEYYLKKAYFLVRAGDAASAIRVYNDMEKITGVVEETARLKHNLYVGLGDYKKAAQEIQRLLDANPTNVGYMNMLASFYEQINDVSNARKVYQQILKSDPQNTRAQIALAGDSKSSGLEYLKSLRPLFENSKLNIDSKVKELIPLINQLAEGKLPEAGQVLAELAEILQSVHPEEAKAHALAGDVYFHTRQSDKALNSYLKTLELDRSVWPVWEQVLYLLNEKNHYQRLLEYSENALDYFPNQAYVYLMNARAFNAMGNGKQGLNAANQGLLMSETNSQLRQEILAEAGIAYFLLKNYSKSNESFEEALRLNAENPIVLKKYAFCLAKHNETNNRIKDIAGKIGSAAPNSSYAEAVLGFSFYAQKNYSQAAEHLQKALSKENNDPLVLEILGNTYYKSGDSAKAIHFWNAALEKLGKNADLEKMISSGKLPE